MSERRYSLVSSYSLSKLTMLIIRAGTPAATRPEPLAPTVGRGGSGRRADRSDERQAGRAGLCVNRIDLSCRCLQEPRQVKRSRHSPRVTDRAVLGRVFTADRLGEINGPTGSAQSTAASDDPVLAEKLWAWAEQFTGIRSQNPPARDEDRAPRLGWCSIYAERAPRYSRATRRRLPMNPASSSNVPFGNACRK